MNSTLALPVPPRRWFVPKLSGWSVSMGMHALAALVLAALWIIRPAEQSKIITVSAWADTPRHEIEWTPPEPKQQPQPTLDSVPIKEDMQPSEIPLPPEEIPLPPGTVSELPNPDPFTKRPSKSAIGTGPLPPGGGPPGFPTRIRDREKAPESLQKAVNAAFLWLARHQSPDGSWSVQGHLNQCDRSDSCRPNPETASADFDAGVTGLAVLAFLGAGYSHLSRDTQDGVCYGDIVRRGIQWMTSHQAADGFVGPHTGHKEMYNHAICALALTEAYGLTQSAMVQEGARKAIDYLVSAQNPGKGWRYTPQCGDNDTSVTGWAVMAFKSAEISGIPFPPAVYEGVRSWLDEATEPSYGRVGYTHSNTGKVYDEHNVEFDSHESLTAAALMARIFMNHSRTDPGNSTCASVILVDKPRWDGPATDFYHWYYASLAMFQYDGPSGPSWSAWNAKLTGALVPTQNGAASGCKAGSWEPVDRWSCEGGRVYATAINALTLEVSYRYPAAFTGSNR